MPEQETPNLGETAQPGVRSCRVCGQPLASQNQKGIHLGCRPPPTRRLQTKTVTCNRLTKDELRLGLLLALHPPEERPKTRGQCLSMPRPCPFVSCRWHLFLDVNPRTGSIKLNFPGRELSELDETCALDVADRGGVVLERVGELLNITRERIRQIEAAALTKIGGDHVLAAAEGAMPLEPPARRGHRGPPAVCNRCHRPSRWRRAGLCRQCVLDDRRAAEAET